VLFFVVFGGIADRFSN